MKRKFYILTLIVFFVTVTSLTVFAYFSFTRDVEVTVPNATLTSANLKFTYRTDNGDVDFNVNSEGLIDSNSDSLYDNESTALCLYATNKQTFNTETYQEVKDVKASISLTTTTLCYVRVKCTEVWEDYKIYVYGASKKEVIAKPNTPYLMNYLLGLTDGDGNNTASDTRNWNYDPLTGYAYYIGTVSGDEEISFFNYSDYEYSVEAASSYRQTIYVNLDFEVEVCQANRAAAIWNVDSSYYERG